MTEITIYNVERGVTIYNIQMAKRMLRWLNGHKNMTDIFINNKNVDKQRYSYCVFNVV